MKLIWMTDPHLDFVGEAGLAALAKAGKTEILSRPSILARNNQPATISLGQQVPLITNTRFDNFGNQINSVSYQNVGINLSVTPFITTDDNVEMVVNPETSELADRSQWVPINASTSNGFRTTAWVNVEPAYINPPAITSSPKIGTPQNYAKFIAEEIPRWTAVVKATGVKLE